MLQEWEASDRKQSRKYFSDGLKSDALLTKWVQNQEGDVDMSEDSIRVGDNLKNREINFQGKDRPDLDMSIRSERLN